MPAAPLHLLYGGTFDPIHLGHLAVARAALASTGGPRLDFLPAADPPHRGAPGAPFADRVALLELALATEPGPTTGTWGIDPREAMRRGPSFTVDTLRGWRREQGADRPLGFVLGADAFHGLPGWHDWRSLFELAHLLLARRPGRPLDDLAPALAEACAGRWRVSGDALREAPAGSVLVVDLPPQPESATAVRQALAEGHPVPGLPAAVEAAIDAQGLYRDPARG